MLCFFSAYRCTEHEKSPGDVCNSEGFTASRLVWGNDWRSARALLSTNSACSQHFQMQKLLVDDVNHFSGFIRLVFESIATLAFVF